jgi:hypothetical protein
MMAAVPQNQPDTQPDPQPDTEDQSVPRQAPPRPPGPALPDRSADETDIGWGDRPDPSDDDRLREDRPPHWDTP